MRDEGAAQSVLERSSGSKLVLESWNPQQGSDGQCGGNSSSGAVATRESRKVAQCSASPSLRKRPLVT